MSCFSIYSSLDSSQLLSFLLQMPEFLKIVIGSILGRVFVGRRYNKTLVYICFILLLKLKSPLIVLSKGFLISGYPCKLYLERKNNWMKCINARLMFHAFIKLFFLVLSKYCRVFNNDDQKFLKSFRQGRRYLAWQFWCLSSVSG